MIRIGLLGCGNVGQIIAREHIDVEIVALFDLLEGRAEALAETCNASAFSDFGEFISQDFDLCVEAASVDAVKAHAEEILRNGKDMIMLSVGALSEEGFKERLESTARETGRRIRIPSGAVFGLDNLKIGQISPITRLTLRTTKSPASLRLETDEKKIIFKGRANDCIRRFPKNINVAIAMGLAAEREAEVELWVDPAIDRNMHEIFVEGDFGEAYIKVRNNPSPGNPATSYLAALSVLTLLKNLDKPIVVGT